MSALQTSSPERSRPSGRSSNDECHGEPRDSSPRLAGSPTLLDQRALGPYERTRAVRERFPAAVASYGRLSGPATRRVLSSSSVRCRAVCTLSSSCG